MPLAEIEPSFSIIIPVKEINDYVRETVPYIQQFIYLKWDLTIVTDSEQESLWPKDSRIRLISSGAVGPALKRDLGVTYSKADFIVFLDDDSYPSKHLLESYAASIQEFECDLVGGPAVTPNSDSTSQKASGATFESRLLGSDAARYRPIGSGHFVDDWPSVNLCVKRNVFNKMGGFDSKFWPGEDSEFCNKVIQSGSSIRYNPAAIVYHHRRAGLRRHVRQVSTYGKHRGYFVKLAHKNSRKLKYFLPSALLLYFCFFTLTGVFINSSYSQLLSLPLLCYLFLITLFILETTIRWGIKVGGLSGIYLICGHFGYGYQFLNGLFSPRKFESKLR